MHKLKIPLIIFIMLIISSLFAIEVSHEYFNNADEMVSRINKLSTIEYTTLKIWVQNSNSNVFGALGTPYNIVYIKDKTKGVTK
jgi:hypothetical protein